jgi:diguanylate cyclase (GGDEF)-like protein
MLAAIGFFIIKQVFDRVTFVTQEAKKIATGDISRKLEIWPADELGELGDALNTLTRNIRDNMEELKEYGEKTTEINLEIQRRMVLFSSLLQISSLITQSAKIDDILKIITEKSLLLPHCETSYLISRDKNQEVFSMKIAAGTGAEGLSDIKVGPQDDLFSGVIKNNKPLIIDANNVLPQDLASIFQEKFKIKNTMALPVWQRGRVIAILGVGNRSESFSYTEEDRRQLDIFAKQIAIAIGNDFLLHRIERLEIRDALTGLYNESYMRSRLQEEIKRSIMLQRPCAYILFDVDNFKKFHQNFGSLEAEGILKKIAVLIKDSVTEIDRVGRTSDDEFAALLPEKNKRQAHSIAEEIRKRIEFSWKEEPDINKRITVSAGVSENPLDGVEADELITKARELLVIAKRQGRNCVVGAKEARTYGSERT